MTYSVRHYDPCPKCNQQPSFKQEGYEIWLECTPCNIKTSREHIMGNDYAYTDLFKNWSAVVRNYNKEINNG